MPCLSIDALVRSGLGHGDGPVKIIVGAGDDQFEVTCRIVVDLDKPHPILEASYTIDSEPITQLIRLDTTPVFDDDKFRFWLMCPNSGQSGHQLLRTTKLFLMPGYTGFACRQCCGLTYRIAKTATNAVQDAAPPPADLPEPEDENLPTTDDPALRAQLAREIAEREDQLEVLRTQLGRLNAVVIRSRRPRDGIEEVLERDQDSADRVACR